MVCSRAPVVRLTPCQVSRQVLHVHLPTSSIGKDLLERHTGLLDHEDRVRTIGDKLGDDDTLRATILSRRHAEHAWRVAKVDSAATFPLAAVDAESERTTDAQIPVHVAVPTSKSFWLRDRRPKDFNVGGKRLVTTATPSPLRDLNEPVNPSPRCSVTVPSFGVVCPC